ncbi:PAS domain-containing sensor histidine kinase [Niastella koreensis]|uniref:histidine kinase n=2 Tax=Niastella koreensis TaxID=354356 RepID=G8TD71_NIAKG|nr:PAS domain-containing sensor histidine kinase [Niastella koreensis]AEV98303.1 PAS/PAC sensor signal transduction histidine kinase [Niastella koreensis GR20-10]OQP53242.1 PAS domain-containing sensor histidine kinase [Niastella koreensis]
MNNIDATHLSALFVHATEGIVLTNGEGAIVLINPAAQRTFGYNETELIGKKVEILLPDRIASHHTELRDGFYHHPQHRVMGHGRDLYGKRKDGSEIPVEVSLSFYKREEELFVIAFIVDITHRKKIEQNILLQQKQLEEMTSDMRKLNAELESKVEERTMILKEALQELEKSQKSLSEALDKEKELSEIKSRFVSMASHEFRTPLSTVLSSAALASKYNQPEDQDKRLRHLNIIKDSVKHLNDLLEDFLSLGKLEEGKVHIKTEQFEVDPFIQEVIEEIKAINRKDQQVHLNCIGDGSFTTDKKLLRNILINLLGNATKFSPENASVWVNVDLNNQKLVLSVKDEGIGIAEEDQQHMFTSFFRGRNAINIQGTGLGLHIVARYVGLLQGNIRLESALNKGTTVTLELPELKEEVDRLTS